MVYIAVKELSQSLTCSLSSLPRPHDGLPHALEDPQTRSTLRLLHAPLGLLHALFCPSITTRASPASHNLTRRLSSQRRLRREERHVNQLVCLASTVTVLVKVVLVKVLLCLTLSLRLLLRVFVFFLFKYI